MPAASAQLTWHEVKWLRCRNARPKPKWLINDLVCRVYHSQRMQTLHLSVKWLRCRNETQAKTLNKWFSMPGLPQPAYMFERNNKQSIEWNFWKEQNLSGVCEQSESIFDERLLLLGSSAYRYAGRTRLYFCSWPCLDHRLQSSFPLLSHIVYSFLRHDPVIWSFWPRGKWTHFWPVLHGKKRRT